MLAPESEWRIRDNFFGSTATDVPVGAAIALCFVAVVGYAMGPLIISTMLDDAPQIAIITLAQVAAAVMYSPLLAYEIATGTWHNVVDCEVFKIKHITTILTLK